MIELGGSGGRLRARIAGWLDAGDVTRPKPAAEIELASADQLDMYRAERPTRGLSRAGARPQGDSLQSLMAHLKSLVECRRVKLFFTCCASVH